MDRYRGKASTLLTKLPWKRNPATTVIPVPKSSRSPAPQTSLIFELPDELILSILSHISPEQQFTGHYAWFRIQYDLMTDDRHRLRVGFLRPLSMTCKEMRLRLIPFIWEHLQLFLVDSVLRKGGGGDGAPRLETLLSALRADMSLAITVKVVSLDVAFKSGFPVFIEFLQSLPNLHTLEVRWWDPYDFFGEPLGNVLKRVKLPQIRTLIIPPAAHPLLRYCHELEDINLVIVEGWMGYSDSVHRSLASNQNSKIRRAAIPLFWESSSRFVTACPKLTELTIVCPHLVRRYVLKTVYLTDQVRMTRRAMLELVNACRMLPNFDTFQIVYFLIPGQQVYSYVRKSDVRIELSNQQQRMRREAKDVGDLLVDCLKLTGTKATYRFIELEPESPEPIHLDSVEVRGCGV